MRFNAFQMVALATGTTSYLYLFYGTGWVRKDQNKGKKGRRFWSLKWFSMIPELGSILA